MAKSKSFFGLRRGSTKSHTYQVNYGQQITKDRVSSVRNPKTTAQCLQRMKMNNARLFYNALNSANARGVINHSFEGVAYNDPTRRAFMSLAMKKAGGPYVAKGIQQWIPGDYDIAKGSLPVPPVVFSTTTPTAGEGQTLVSIMSGDTLTADNVADLNALNIATGAQVSMVVVTKNGSLYEAYAFEFKNQVGEVLIDTDFGWGLYILKTTATGAIVSATLNVGPYAGAIIISQQDQSGKWLRSNSRMWISDDIRAEFYSSTALETALQSYQLDASLNSLNSAYFLNQAGASRAYDGAIIALTTSGIGGNATFIAGMINVDGAVRFQYITDDGQLTGHLIGIDGNALALTPNDIDGNEDMGGFTLPSNSSGYPMVVQYDAAMLSQGGF